MFKSLNTNHSQSGVKTGNSISAGNGFSIPQFWSPLTPDNIRDYHQDLVTIVSKYNWRPGMMMTEHNMHEASLRAYLITKLEKIEFEGGRQLKLKFGQGSEDVVPYEPETIDLSIGKLRWYTNEFLDAYYIDKMGSFFAHRACWELLQGINHQDEDAEGCVTPRNFWKAAWLFKAQLDNTTINQVGRSVNTPSWLENGDIVHGGNMWSPAEDKDFAATLAKAMSTSSSSSVMDITVRNELWTKLKAWCYHSLDGFPLELICKSHHLFGKISAPVTKSDSLLLSSLGSLPLEVLEEVIKQVHHLNDKDAFAFASTCHQLRQLTLPHLNKMAFNTVLSDHRWMLPATPAEKRKWDTNIGKVNDKWLCSKTDFKDMLEFPWLLYKMQCLHKFNWSMGNRSRVWSSVTSIYHDLKEKDFLEDLSPSCGS